MDKVYIAYPHTGTLYHEFHISLMRTLQDEDRGYDVMIQGAFGGAASVARTRNKIVGAFLESDCSHLLMCDPDGCWKPSDIKRLLDHDLDIVAGHAMGQDGFSEDEVFSAVLDLGDDGQPHRRPMGEGLTRVDIVGGHFTLIKREVLEALGNEPGLPYAPTRFMNKATRTYSYVGEDTTFSLRAKEAGFEVWVDYDCPVGHIKTRILWPPNAGDDPLEVGTRSTVKFDVAADSGYASHLPVLRWLVENTEGPILEIGAGKHSTPVFQASGREFTSVEPEHNWRKALEEYAPGVHWVVRTPDEGHYGLVFLDQDPESARPKTLERLRDHFDVAFVHDVWPGTYRTRPYKRLQFADWPEIAESFPYHWWFIPDDGLPPTLVLGNVPLKVPESLPGGRVTP